MRRRSIWLLVTTAVALLATACSGDGGALDEAAGGGATSAGGAETLTFSAPTFAEPGRGPKLEAYLQEFNASQDDVVVEPVSIPYASYANTIFTQMGGGGGPCIVRLDIDDFYAAVEAGLLAPLDEVIDEGDYDFLSPDKYTKVDDTRYGVLFEISNYTLIYNSALLPDAERPPATFDEFLETAKAATDGNTSGFAFRTTMPEVGGAWYDLSNFVYGFGGRWSTSEGEPTIDSPQVLEGLKAFVQVYDSGVTPKGTDAATYRRMMWEDKVAMLVDNGGVATSVSSNFEDPETFGATDTPFPEDERAQILAMVGINSNCEQKEAAAQFIHWVLQPENQQNLMLVLGASSVATDVERPQEQIEAMPWVEAYDRATEHGVPVTPEGLETSTPEIRQIVIEQVEKVLQGDLTPEEALATAQQQVLDQVVDK